MTDTVTLRSVAWDGDAPAPGDVVRSGDDVLVVEAVAAGAGVGHWRLDCRRPRIIEWREASWR